MSKTSSRAPALSARAVEAGITLGRRDLARTETAEGFAGLVQQRASEVDAAGGQEASDGDDDVVAVEQPVAPAAAKKSKKARKSKIWNTGFDLMLAQGGLKHEVWKVPGSGRTVIQRWDACWKSLNEEPFVRVFGSKDSKSSKARYEKLVDGQSKRNGQAQRDSGAGTAGNDLDNENEKKAKAELKQRQRRRRATRRRASFLAAHLVLATLCSLARPGWGFLPGPAPSAPRQPCPASSRRHHPLADFQRTSRGGVTEINGGASRDGSASSTVSVSAGAASHETDVVVIGSGVGGLSAAAMLSRHGDSVTVLESHYLPGGVAHAFDIEGYRFDAGPSLWAGMSESGTNPLRQILDILDEQVDWINYDGWGMHVPEGYFRFTTGPDAFVEELRRLGGEDDVRQWRELTEKMRPLLRASASIPPLALRGDYWAPVTLLPYLVDALRHAGPGVQALQGAFTDVLEGTVKWDSFLFKWLDYLSFALSGLPADGTMAAAVIYTIGDLHRPGCVIDYPKGGGGVVIAAMVKGIEKLGGRVELKSHVKEIIVEGGRAVGVKLRSGAVVRARKAIVSNASIWDTIGLIPEGAVDPKYIEESMDTPDTGSFMHVHLGIDGKGLDDLDIHYSVVESWDVPIDAPQNMFIVSIPTVLDPSLAPEGKHLVHIYTAGNEPYHLWEGMKRGSPEYEALKKERAEGMWKALERIIPDVRRRTEVELVATPLTHEFFSRRFKGSYGPGRRAGEAEFPGCVTPLKGLLHCGDSTLPGLGLPAVAASGMSAASTITPVWKQLGLLWDMQRRGLIDSKFNDF